MNTVRSSDGTAIAYERSGHGPPVILVDGALCQRGFGPSRKLASLLAHDHTVYTYDRRGRGESGDSAPYSVAREVEDLDALVEEAGGTAHLYGISSGAALALEAAHRGLAVEKLVLYEPPFIVDDSRPPIAESYVPDLDRLILDGRRGAAVKLFMRQVGVPAPFVAAMPLMPAWSKLRAAAHTLLYDAAVMGDTQSGSPLPEDRWDGVTADTLVVVGGRSPAWMKRGTQELAAVLPRASRYTLAGQTHMVKPAALAPLLGEFFGGEEAAVRIPMSSGIAAAPA